MEGTLFTNVYYIKCKNPFFFFFTLIFFILHIIFYFQSRQLLIQKSREPSAGLSVLDKDWITPTVTTRTQEVSDESSSG